MLGANRDVGSARVEEEGSSEERALFLRRVEDSSSSGYLELVSSMLLQLTFHARLVMDTLNPEDKFT